MSSVDRLLEIMRRLRDPQTGCPWDVEQDFASIAPYTIEEAYEVADAIDRGDFDDLRDELGDLLLQVVFHAQMASEAGRFGFSEVVAAICDKLVRRHPHVFGDEPQTASAQAQKGAWEAMKADERGQAGQHSALDGIAAGLPEWLRASKLHSRAARVGFDWPGPDAVLEKVDEELAELRQACCDREIDTASEAVEEEYGDLLFAMLALARHLKIDAGSALRSANAKFERRFRAVEQRAIQRGESLEDLDDDALDRLWREVKQQFKGDADA